MTTLFEKEFRAAMEKRRMEVDRKLGRHCRCGAPIPPTWEKEICASCQGKARLKRRTA